MKVPHFNNLAADIKHWGKSLGFQEVSIASIALDKTETRLNAWLAKGYHGTMGYMAKHGSKRSRPAELVPGTVSVICARLNYLTAPPNTPDSSKAEIARYAWGRDYHKIIPKKLKALAKQIEASIGEFGYRVFTDSAPVMERALGENAGLGWIGKNTLLMSRDAGPWFLLGEIYTDIPLPPDQPVASHCGTCTRCLDQCPTNAFVSPYILDSNKCISYLTIEYKGSIPVELRPKMGNRIFGCDECMVVCPFTKFATISDEPDFQPRHHLNDSRLVDLFLWTEEEFLKKTEGSAIRRTGYTGWLRNIAVALGNAEPSAEIINALKKRQGYPNDIVQEHVDWAIQHLQQK